MSGKPAARVTDPTACPISGHGTNPIVSGSPDVLFDGLPAARQGDPTACGSGLASNLVANVFINTIFQTFYVCNKKIITNQLAFAANAVS